MNHSDPKDKIPTHGRQGSILRVISIFATIGVATLNGACADTWMRCSRWMLAGWVGDYSTAERLVAREGKPLLIAYCTDHRTRRDDVQGWLSEATVSSRLRDDYVCCKLFATNEAHRRYLAQFGVERAPAIVIVHTDGTFTATSRDLTAEGTKAFLDEARPPGRSPMWDPLIPRKPLYVWHRSMEAAKAESDQTGRPILVVIERSLSQDPRQIDRLLNQHMVYLRLEPMVHYRMTAGHILKPSAATVFGELELPALVIVHNDGTFETLERPDSPEVVAAFADRCLHRLASSDSEARKRRSSR